MIAGLDKLLEGSNQPGLAQLRELLPEVLGGRDRSGKFLGHELLQPKGQRVVRLRFFIDGQARSVIAKRLAPAIARRNELVIQRWLPAVGLECRGPSLLGSVAARNGQCVWHVYDDLGNWELDPHAPDYEPVQAAVELIAQLHTRFAAHPLLGEVRLHGGDFGIHFYESNVRDAIVAMEALQPSPEHRDVHARLLNRLQKLRADVPRRAQVLGELAGPETLLHGDLWAINVFVIQNGNQWHARLIDWDHAAVGPASYDLSTFLLRFPPGDRHWILELYRKAIPANGWQLPSPHDLNALFETHEYARFANRIIWPAIALAVDRADWGWAELAEVESWFEKFSPILSEHPVTVKENTEAFACSLGPHFGKQDKILTL